MECSRDDRNWRHGFMRRARCHCHCHYRAWRPEAPTEAWQGRGGGHRTATRCRVRGCGYGTKATRRAAIRICATSCIVSMLEALSPTWRRCPPPACSCLPCLPRGKPDQLWDASMHCIVTCNLTLVQPQECPPGCSSGRCRGPDSVSRAASSSPQLVVPAGVPPTRTLTTAPSTTARGAIHL
jgi:hypothetical protein